MRRVAILAFVSVLLWIFALPARAQLSLTPRQAPAPLWWCAPLRQYYPTVQTCPAQWLQVARPPGLSQPPPQAEQASDPHCEAIADKARRDACFVQAGIPIVDCHHPQNADDIGFCRQVSGTAAANQNPPQPLGTASPASPSAAQAQPPTPPPSTQAQPFPKYDANQIAALLDKTDPTRSIARSPPESQAQPPLAPTASASRAPVLGVLALIGFAAAFIAWPTFRKICLFLSIAMVCLWFLYYMQQTPRSDENAAVSEAKDAQQHTDFDHDYEILQESGRKLVAAGALKYDISGWHQSLDITLPDLSTGAASAIVNGACNQVTDLQGEWSIRVYLVDGKLAGECSLKRHYDSELDEAQASMDKTLREKPWREGFLRALDPHPMPPLSPAETRCRQMIDKMAGQCRTDSDFTNPQCSGEIVQRDIDVCDEDLRKEWMASH